MPSGKIIGITATVITLSGFVAQTFAIILRWKEFADLSGMGFMRSAPLTNLYESLIFFVWCLILGYLIIEFKFKNRSFGAFITPIQGRSGNAEAYRLYLQGAFFQNRDTAEDVGKAIDFFKGAVRLDAGYAQAWASLSYCYLHQGTNAWVPFEQATERARQAARRAVAVGPDVAAGHWALGAVLLWHDWDWQGAEASIRRALQLGPEGSHLILAARVLQTLGQLDEAAALVEQALMLDPLNVQAHITTGLQSVYTGRSPSAWPGD